MKRSWFSKIVVAGLLGLLTLVAVLQYHLLVQIGEVDREKMQKRLQTDTDLFAADFNREMQAAYFNFQTGAEMWKNRDWAEFNERFDYWKEKTEYPTLIRDFYFFEKTPGSDQMRYDTETRKFAATAVTVELKDIRARLTAEATDRLVYEDLFAMVMPVYSGDKRIDRIVLAHPGADAPPLARMPEKFGYLVVMLDEATIKERILPGLAAKYFATDEYKLSVVDSNQEAIFATRDVTTAADAKASLLKLTPDNLLFFANRHLIERPGVGHAREVVVNQRVESHTFSRTESHGGKTGTFEVEMQRSGEKGKPRTMIASTVGGIDPWTLQVQHTAGSVDNFITNTRRQNLAIGFGLLALIAASILLIFVSAQRAKKLAQRQVDFVSSVSHEFRTPLAVIYSAGENLADGVTKEETQISRYGNLIKGEGKKLSAMVEQILEFAGADSRRKRYNLIDVSVNEIVADAIAECYPLLKENGFTIEKEIAHDLPQVVGDKEALSRSIQNLIANSIKYGNGEKWLKVSAVNGGQTVKITVEDRGPGISKGDLRQIFEPFYRSKSAVDAQIHGNGLGLSIVRQIVEEHGGKVSAESEVGKGSRFIIELPQR